jgi:hypothetical protein
MNHIAKILCLTGALVAAHAQVTDQVRRATISGSGGSSGKCTIEVRVDMSAEVDIYGDSGRLRTLAGQPATWTRLECTSTLPANMTDFRFRGVDGRGNVKMLQDPRNNNSMAVIRIDDPRSGAEGYTFEIEWSGGSGTTPTGGFSSSGWGTPAENAITPSATSSGPQPNRGWGAGRGNRMSAERAIDLCRAEVRTRGERDYGLRAMEITSAAVDTAQGRRDWITGTFTDRSGNSRRGGGYRYGCEVDYVAGQVRSVELRRADGSVMQPTNASGMPYQGAAMNPTGYDQNRAYRACQDAVVARTNRDGYQNVVFGNTAIDTSRTEWISGNITATRGPVTDTFDFGCSMDLRAGTVRNLEVKRR